MELLKQNDAVDIKVFSQEIAKEMLDSVQSGKRTPIYVLAVLKSLQDVIDKVKAEVMPGAMELFDSVGESSVDVNGVKIYKNSGGRYDYSDNTEIKELDSRIKSIQEMMKQAYEAEKNGASFVTDDGEIVSAAKFIPNKPSLTIKF
jgi:hypothetical protein